MAEKKMTEVQALRNALAGVLDTETVDKLNHMIEVRSRKYDRKVDDSKRIANMALGDQFIEVWDAEKPFKASDLAKALNITTAKACAVIKAMEWVTVPTTEKVNVYML